MPKNIAEAIALFRSVNQTSNAEKVGDSMERYLKLLANGPDGKTKVSIGKGCICWSCGYLGLPANADAAEGDTFVAAKCRVCGLDNDTNYVQGTQPDGTTIPFIEQA